MNVTESFLGIYVAALRVLLPCLTGQECKLMLALALHTDNRGVAFPGVRELSDLTTFPPDLVSELLKQLEARQIALCVEGSRYDFLKKRIVSAVYIGNPEIFVVSDPSLWQEVRLKHSNMLESPFPLKSAQPESDSQNQILGTRRSEADSTAFEGAASLSKDYANQSRQTMANTTSNHVGTSSTAGSANAPNSTAQPKIPPGSAASPLRPMTFQESIQVAAIRQHIADMSAKTAMELVALYGVELVGQAVTMCERRDKVTPIAKKTGWIKTYLKSTRSKK